MAGSLMTGMSWDGMSVGSLLKDSEYVGLFRRVNITIVGMLTFDISITMHGTSPFSFAANGYKSPSYHSSSYMQKFEANFMTDLNCCGVKCKDLHELLQHYEQQHAQQIQPTTAGPPPPVTTAASSTAVGKYNLQHNQPEPQPQSIRPSTIQPAMAPQHFMTGNMQSLAQARGGNAQSPINLDQEPDTFGELDMFEDSSFTYDFSPPVRTQQPPRSQIGQPRVPPLDLNPANLSIKPLHQYQGMRSSHSSEPSTPLSAATKSPSLFQNPTVSSVNTPTLTAHPVSRQFRESPNSSTPGTPAELDLDFMVTVNNMSMDNRTSYMEQHLQDGFGNSNHSRMNSGADSPCIDNPGKSLFQPNGSLNDQSRVHARLGNAQYGPMSDIARTIRERQTKAGLPDTMSNLNPGEEPKPFRCPVIGCEKAYKNQNGLKYHRTVSKAHQACLSNLTSLQHGHNNQALKENVDGTFSIINPETQSPYPGTLGMEKEKPYKCDVCGKRYKNLNGLKYHKTHSLPCDPDRKVDPASPINTTDASANVAGVGLIGT